jgi:hypothetical protein
VVAISWGLNVDTTITWEPTSLGSDRVLLLHVDSFTETLSKMEHRREHLARSAAKSNFRSVIEPKSPPGDRVTKGEKVGITVAVDVGDTESVLVGEADGDSVAVGDGLVVDVGVGDWLGLELDVSVGVGEGLGVDVDVGVGVEVGDSVAEALVVGVGVAVDVEVGDWVEVDVGDGEGV